MRIRIRFEKTGPVRFVGHLDFMRMFQKCIRKSGLDAVYTAGFNPHMLLSFAAPLGVGEETTGDCVDVEFAYRDPGVLTEQEAYRMKDIGLDNEHLPDPPAAAELTARLDKAMPQGVSVTGAARVGLTKDSKAMALVRFASWDLMLAEEALPGQSAESLAERTRAFLDRPEIRVMKHTKKAERETDIRPLIRSLTAVKGPEGERILHLTCAAGSTQNLKPAAVLEAFGSWCGEETPHRLSRLVRTELMDGEMRPLLSLGTPF